MKKLLAALLSCSLLLSACALNNMEGQVIPDSGFDGAMFNETGAPVIDFNQADYEAALETDKLVVLYFYATWCPLCRVEFPKMVDAFETLDPESAIGFRVNYNDGDTDEFEQQLADDFGVTYQHHKVYMRGGEILQQEKTTLNLEEHIEALNQHL